MRLLILIAGIALLTLAFLALDSQASFLFGDSAVYVTTAVGKWIPPDRSFIYGLILRPLAVWPRSFEPVIVIQALSSIASSWIAGFVLIRYFGVSFAVASCSAIACALEPLQLMSQRYILPDSLALFVFALFLLAGLSYLKTSSISQLAVVQILGVLLVSLRLSFLAVVIVLSLLLPLLSRRARSMWRRRKLRSLALPLLFSILVSQGLLFGYRYVYGDLIGKPPAYLYRDGLFLLADIAPLLKPVPGLKYPLTERPSQRWAPGGLCDLAIRQAGGDEDIANARARQTALQTIRDNPAGVLALTAETYADYFRYGLLHDELVAEQGRNGTLSPREKDMFQTVFSVDPARVSSGTLTKRWETHATLWCWLVMAFPLVSISYLALRRRRVTPAQVICAVCALILIVEASFAVEHPVTRDLIPIAWLTIVMIGSTQRSDTRNRKGVLGWSVRRASVSGAA